MIELLMPLAVIVPKSLWNQGGRAQSLSHTGLQSVVGSCCAGIWVTPFTSPDSVSQFSVEKRVYVKAPSRSYSVFYFIAFTNKIFVATLYLLSGPGKTYNY